MRRVYKYPLPDTGVVALPEGAQVLRIDIQGSSLFVWALIDTRIVSTEDRKFAVYGTGEDILNDVTLNYINTFMPCEHQFVFHAFEII